MKKEWFEIMGIIFYVLIIFVITVGIVHGISKSVEYFQTLNAKQESFQGSIYELNAKTSDLQDKVNNMLISRSYSYHLPNDQTLVDATGQVKGVAFINDSTKGWECTKTDTWDCTQDTDDPKEITLQQNGSFGVKSEIIGDVT